MLPAGLRAALTGGTGSNDHRLFVASLIRCGLGVAIWRSCPGEARMVVAAAPQLLWQIPARRKAVLHSHWDGLHTYPQNSPVEIGSNRIENRIAPPPSVAKTRSSPVTMRAASVLPWRPVKS